MRKKVILFSIAALPFELQVEYQDAGKTKNRTNVHTDYGTKIYSENSHRQSYAHHISQGHAQNQFP